MSFIIVSGLSGSGKSIALQALEDLGFYCIDNLPASLLPSFTREFATVSDAEFSGCAVGIDSRNRGFLEALPDTLAEIMGRGLDCRILFLESEENILINRYSETRRRHPLTDGDTALIEGIRREREFLLPLRMAATRIIDTSHTTPQKLRNLVREFAGDRGDSKLTLLFESFGYKLGPPGDANFVFDVRCIPNPYWVSELRDLNGRDAKVIDFFRTKDDAQQMIEDIRAFMENWLPRFKAENRTYVTVAIGCTGGQHRSVYIADRLAAEFGDEDLNIQVRHRELNG